MEPPGKVRKIIHIDMDMFYAAVELRDRPELKDKPVVVGGPPNSRSVVTTANYEARKFGIRSAMSCAEAFKRCPQCLFIPPDFAKYERVSEQIREIFREYTDLVEPMSLDEAYLDVTVNKINEPSATRIAAEIKKKIRERTGLTASAGVAPSLFVAKIASDFRKPDGLCVVRPEQVLDFIRPLPVIKIPGIGRKTEVELAKLDIRTVADLAQRSAESLEERFGKFGRYLYDIARGIDEREVTPFRQRQSFGAEETFPSDVVDSAALLSYLEEYAERLFKELTKEGLQARTVTLKIKYHDFRTITRRLTREHFLQSADDVFQTAKNLLRRTDAGRIPVRLAGIALANFKEKAPQGKERPKPLLFSELEGSHLKE